jgi:hypothetical protein
MNRIMQEIEFEDDYEGLNGNNSDYFNPWIK